MITTGNFRMATKIGKIVQNFYNETPFPDFNLSRFNSKEDLKLSMYTFAEILDRSIPKDASIIDVGTGTGQLSAYLSLRRKKVVGVDFSKSSLLKAKKLKEKLKLNSLELKQVDLLDENQMRKLGKFDYVLCLGVLHHTGNAYKGFQNVVNLLNPGGKIALGLYNTFGRIPLKIRVLLAKSIFKDNDRVKNYFIKMQIGEVADKERARGWWNDQYEHPHETTHTIGEVLRWFKKNNIEFMQLVPTSNLFGGQNLKIGGVWNEINESKPKLLRRIFRQAMWIIETQREGGYWITFGRLKE